MLELADVSLTRSGMCSATAEPIRVLAAGQQRIATLLLTDRDGTAFRGISTAS
jgi:hypothetical protein